MQNKNLILAIALSLLLSVGWMQLGRYLWPPKPVAQLDLNKEAMTDRSESPRSEGAARGAIAGPWANLKKPAAPPPKAAVARIPPPAPPTPPDKLLTLGDEDPSSPFHLKVVLDPRGAGVRSVIPNKFQQADDEGRPVWRDPATKKTAAPLELVPAAANQDVPSDVLYHFKDPEDPRPWDTLGKIAWAPVGPVAHEKTEDGRQRDTMAFQTDVQGVRIRKTFTLTEGDYHIGLEVTLTRLDDSPRKFRYQLAGAHGLPIEGRWYTSTFRNALIARVEGNDVWRDVQTLPEISRWEGGKEIVKAPGQPIRYAGVAVQYFASMLVVDDQQTNQDFLRQARPTLETAVARGVVRKVDRERGTFVLRVGDNDDRSFHLANDPALRAELETLKEGVRRAVVYHSTGQPDPTDSKYDLALATQIAPEMAIQPLWEEDITVRVTTEALDLKQGAPVTHKYLLYNGPVKPSLLAGQTGAAAVSPELVNRYANVLGLNTMTDYPSSNAVARFFNYIGWTKLIIWFTNVMHGLLGFLHRIVPSYGICIILLTIMVRGIMFPMSRKQAMMSIKMQELAPEMKKIQEKYKDDPQARGLAQMELYRRHKISPFGTCWLLLLQMPVFMGLYFALQESIQFRLAPFWPTWIINLAAPDMLVYWGQGIPMISQPESYGGLLYLGPYFNLLPVIAVVLMIMQQKMMTPPATNDEEATRNAMMKYMMIFFGLMFYKVASGLCLYFVASSLWGFAERKLLPKKKLGAGSLAEVTVASAAEPARPSRRRPERGRRDGEDSALGRVRSWWHEVLKQAEKK